jgi:outer membrane protein
MKRLNPLYVLPLLLAAFAAPAAAQVNIAVMNEERVLRESAVGQHIQARVVEIRDEIDAELAAISGPIQTETQAINTETANMTEEGVRNRPDLVARIQTVNEQVAEFEQTRRLRQQELVATERQAMRPVFEALQEVLEEVVAERGIDILVDRSQLVFATPDVDITPAVIAALDARLPTVPVNRARLPQAAAEAPASEQ